MFSQSVRTDGGNLQIVVLNDRTVEALFGASPAKAAFRTKARMTSVFFVQGTTTKDFEFKPEVSVVQKGETLDGKATNMKNFTGGKVAKGEVGARSRRAAEEAGSLRALQVHHQRRIGRVPHQSGRPQRLRKPMKRLRQRQRDQLRRSSGGRDGDDDVLLVVDAVGHRRAGGVGRQQRFRHDLASRLVVRAEP